MTDRSPMNCFAVTLVPTEVCLAWIKSCPDGDDDLTMAQLQDEPTIFSLPEGRLDPETSIRRHYKTMFEEELDSWYSDQDLWPKDLSFKNFKRFFTICVSTMVFDLGERRRVGGDE